MFHALIRLEFRSHCDWCFDFELSEKKLYHLAPDELIFIRTIGRRVSEWWLVEKKKIIIEFRYFGKVPEFVVCKVLSTRVKLIRIFSRNEIGWRGKRNNYDVNA